jgi:phage terminase small subunit
MAMTDMKRAFADALISGAAKNISNRDAAIEAGYSESTASQMGSKLAKDKDVKRYMAQQKLNNSEAIKAEVKAEPKMTGNKSDPKDILLDLLNNADPTIALKAATALMPYMYARIAPAGKKEGEKQSAIKATKTGRFATLSQQSNKIQ